MRNPFTYVPPEERSGCLRRLGFVTATGLVLIGLLLLGLCGYGFATDQPTYYASLRLAIGFVVGGAALAAWLREDPQRR